MFEEVNKYTIKVRNEKEKNISYIPNVISINPIDNLFTATMWLVKEALEDYLNTNKKVEERRNEHGYSQENLDDIDSLSIRLGSRTQSYVNQLCLMEDILIFEYKRMAKLVKLASNNKINFNPEEDYKTLKNRLSSIRTFRNKVVAHTAYTYPKSEDNPETIIRSIMNLFPQPTHITLGDNSYSGFSMIKSQLPIITIFNWEEEIKPIFEDWKKLFIERLKKIHTQCPFESKKFGIEIAYPHYLRRK